jgi:dihydrofolate reductase
MKKIISYIAISLNGKIARADGRVDWLENIPNPENTDYGYYKFYESVDTSIQGYGTYKQLMSWDIPFPYQEIKNYVLTSKTMANTKDVEFINMDQILDIKKNKGKNIWLIGGGITNTEFLNKGLLDEIILHIMPIIIPDGLDLFANIPNETMLQLINSKTYKSGVVEMHYQVKYRGSI